MAEEKTLTASQEARLEEIASSVIDDAVGSAIRIGNLLIEAKEMLPHGQFIAWTEDRCGLTRSTASIYVRIARKWANVDSNQHLSLTVLRELLPDSVPDEATQTLIERSESGEKITVKAARAAIAKAKAAAKPQEEQAPEEDAQQELDEEPEPEEEPAADPEPDLASRPAESPSADPKPSTPKTHPVATQEKHLPPEEPVPLIERARNILREVGKDNAAEFYGFVEQWAIRHGAIPKQFPNSVKAAEKTLAKATDKELADAVSFLTACMKSRGITPEAPKRVTGELLDFDPYDVVPPGKLNCPKFLKHWRMWCDYHVESDEKLPQTVVTMQLNQLKSRSVDAACAAIGKAISERKFSIPEAKSVKTHFKPPTVEEVQRFIDERNIKTVDATKFFNYYAAQGWKLANGVKMSDWKLALLRHEDRNKEAQPTTNDLRKLPNDTRTKPKFTVDPDEIYGNRATS